MSSITFTLIQSDIIWQNVKANLVAFEKKIDTISSTQIVVLPEMFSTGFSMQPELFAEEMNGTTVNWMKKIAAKKKIILTGSVMIAEGGKFFNRLIWMMPNGEMGFYDKRHLFAFAGEHDKFQQGKSRTITSVNKWKILLQICYDLRFPVWARQSKTANHDDTANQPEYDILLFVANWPQKRIHAWKTLLMARAIENQCYVIGVNRVGVDGKDILYSGESMVIDPLGEIVYALGDGEKEFTFTLNRDILDAIRLNYPFLKDGDSFITYP